MNRSTYLWSCILSVIFAIFAHGQSPVHIQQIQYQNNAKLTQVPILIENTFVVTTNKVLTVIQNGNQNTLDVKAFGDNQDLSYAQKGNTNYIDVNVQGYDIKQNIVQSGDNNTFSQYSNNPFIEQNIQVFQNGTNLDVSVFGENSISKDMQIYMQGDQRSLIINNFN
ncbi:hypothetical protein [Myroides sp. LJL119]